jgi:hypothetical protein
MLLPPPPARYMRTHNRVDSVDTAEGRKGRTGGIGRMGRMGKASLQPRSGA